MARAAEARAWWADVEDVRERIERRRARELRARRSVAASGGLTPAPQRGVREIRPGRRLVLVPSHAPSAPSPRRTRPRPRAIQRVGPRPDRIAAWAFALGVMLVLAAILSAH